MAHLVFGRLSARDRMKMQTLEAMHAILMGVAGNTAVLLQTVAGGPQDWRNRFLRETRGLAVDAGVADQLFAFFCHQVQARFGHELSPARLLDALEVSSPPTQREIDESWEAESFSSEEGRRYFYGADGHPEQLIKQMGN